MEGEEERSSAGQSRSRDAMSLGAVVYDGSGGRTLEGCGDAGESWREGCDRDGGGGMMGMGMGMGASSTRQDRTRRPRGRYFFRGAAVHTSRCAPHVLSCPLFSFASLFWWQGFLFLSSKLSRANLQQKAVGLVSNRAASPNRYRPATSSVTCEAPLETSTATCETSRDLPSAAAIAKKKHQKHTHVAASLWHPHTHIFCCHPAAGRRGR
ncbi:hypothetical protein DM02DRAFT_182626 [Periconia macrospinosa]|uniref:Uncharacterized protein n=1 Tax=Periconia macrospinosa TaxID=97972 RepID=A0A2V1D9H6_9PLEO|nr:hypothetical protein DM02DRAFT_182626 [Periconia macrospinosa]